MEGGAVECLFVCLSLAGRKGCRDAKLGCLVFKKRVARFDRSKGKQPWATSWESSRVGFMAGELCCELHHDSMVHVGVITSRAWDITCWAALHRFDTGIQGTHGNMVGWKQAWRSLIVLLMLFR